MKMNSLAERGQALILIAFAAIGLVAIVALAIDGTAKFSDRRHARERGGCFGSGCGAGESQFRD